MYMLSKSTSFLVYIEMTLYFIKNIIYDYAVVVII